MKKKRLALMLACTGMFMSVAAFAHDPSEHEGKGEAPDCSAMKDMKHKEMKDMDPVMMAMMMQCREHEQGHHHKHEGKHKKKGHKHHHDGGRDDDHEHDEGDHHDKDGS